jgi:hypothetical protein
MASGIQEVFTDVVPPLNCIFRGVRIVITSVQKGVQDNAATMSVEVKGGAKLVGGNTDGGRYGWVAFGYKWGGEYYWGERKPLNWKKHYFVPDDPRGAQAVRLWLRDGVKGDFVVDSESIFIVRLAEISKLLLQLIRLSKTTTTTPALPGKQLPAKLP